MQPKEDPVATVSHTIIMHHISWQFSCPLLYLNEAFDTNIIVSAVGAHDAYIQTVEVGYKYRGVSLLNAYSIANRSYLVRQVLGLTRAAVIAYSSSEVFGIGPCVSHIE